MMPTFIIYGSYEKENTSYERRDNYLYVTSGKGLNPAYVRDKVRT